MPIMIVWDDPSQKTITRLTFVDVVRINHMLAAWKEEADIQRAVSHPVYSLNDFNLIKIVVPQISVRQLVTFVKHNMPSNLEMTVQVASDPTIRHSLQIIATFMPHEVHIVPTFKEAYTIINQRKTQFLQASLPDHY